MLVINYFYAAMKQNLIDDNRLMENLIK